MPVIQSLQAFRGFAALAVVAHHAVISTNAFVGLVPGQVEAVLGMGYLGVDFFFVLSGFIIMYTHMEDERSAPAIRSYVFKRLVRIFTPYLPISIAMIALYDVLPGFSASGDRDFSLASSILLVPAEYPPALSVAWTLVHEMQFYAFFLLFYVSRRALIAGLFMWMCVTLISNLMFTPVGWARYPLSLLNVEFMFGVLAAWMVRARVVRIPPGFLVFTGVTLASAMLAIMDVDVDSLSVARLFFAFGLSLVVFGFALREKKCSLAWPSLLLLVGNASYSIYLVHSPLLSVSQRLAGGLALGWLQALIFGVVVSVFVGWLYYRCIEQPALRFFRKQMMVLR
jgi:peptidoglycan/LPS O-acetylase OafA/YrhL